MRKVKWGVLGVAKIAVEKVIPAMQQGEASQIAAIASRDLGKARAAAEKLGIARAFGSYEELLADPEIEAVYNPLPNELHVPWTVRALEAGQACAVREADRARRRRGARADRARATASGKLVAEAFMVRFHPQWRRAQELAQLGTDRRRRARSRPSSPIACSTPRMSATVRRAAAGSTTSAATRSSPRATFSAPSRRAWPRRSTATRISAPTGWRAPFSNFPAGAIRLSPSRRNCQRISGSTIVGDAGRIEVLIPFNAPPDRPTESPSTPAPISFGGGARVEQFPACDQYTLQGDAFSRAILRRGAARISDRGRDRQHARHRRAVSARPKTDRGRSPGRRYVSIEGHMHLIAGWFKA